MEDHFLHHILFCLCIVPLPEDQTRQGWELNSWLMAHRQRPNPLDETNSLSPSRRQKEHVKKQHTIPFISYLVFTVPKHFWWLIQEFYGPDAARLYIALTHISVYCIGMDCECAIHCLCMLLLLLVIYLLILKAVSSASHHLELNLMC